MVGDGDRGGKRGWGAGGGGGEGGPGGGGVEKDYNITRVSRCSIAFQKMLRRRGTPALLFSIR